LAPAVFLWFAGIGALTVAMSGGFRPRERRPKVAATADTEASESVAEVGAGSVDEQVESIDPGTAELAADTAENPIATDAETGPASEEKPDPRRATESGPPLAELDPEDHFVVDEPDSTGADHEVDSGGGSDRGDRGS
jgi:hypothetical protein